MRDEQDGCAGLKPDAAQFLVEPVARDLVERAERLVHEQDARAAEQGARDRDTLAHAARELMREASFPAFEAHEPQELARRRRARRQAAMPADLERQRDILERRAPGQERRVLEDEAQRPVEPGFTRRAAKHGDRSARRREKIGDEPQERGLAAPRWPEKAHETAAL